NEVARLEARVDAMERPRRHLLAWIEHEADRLHPIRAGGELDGAAAERKASRAAAHHGRDAEQQLVRRTRRLEVPDADLHAIEPHGRSVPHCGSVDSGPG